MTKTFFITGVSSGIGREMTRQLVRQGHHVFGCARRKERLVDLENELGDAASRFRHAICDVTRRADLDQSVRLAVQQFGKIDVVVANAGFGVAGAFQKLRVEDFRHQFETNVFGVLHTVQACLNNIIESKGSIVLMGSVNAHLAEAKKTPYCMSKFAIKALADGLYWEMKPKGVAVTLLSPGIVESEIRQVDNSGIHHPGVKDPAPATLIMDTPAAARQMIRAIHARKREKVITLHGALAVLLNRYAPFLLTPLLKQAKPVSRPNVT